MTRYLCLLAACVALVGCGSKPEPEPTKTIAPAPSNTTSETSPGPAEADLPKVLDLPTYPGAKVVKNEVAKTSGGNRYHVTLQTPDPLDKVTAFYKGQGIPFMSKGDFAQAMGTTKHGNNVIIDMSRKGDTTEIAIRLSPTEH